MTMWVEIIYNCNARNIIKKNGGQHDPMDLGLELDDLFLGRLCSRGLDGELFLFDLCLVLESCLFLDKYVVVVVVGALVEIDLADGRDAGLVLGQLAILGKMVDLATETAAAAIDIQALAVLRTLPCQMALTITYKALCKW